MQKLLCVVNPNSGDGMGARVQTALKQLCTRRLVNAEICELGSPHLGAALRQNEGCAILLAAGGDGSISTVVRESLGLGFKTAILPLGTGNDFARQFGIKPLKRLQDLEARLKAIDTWQPRRISIPRIDALKQGQTSSLPFCNYVSFGFDASTVSGYNRWQRRCPRLFMVFGPLGRRAAYAASGLKALRTKIKPGVSVFAAGREIYCSASRPARSIVFSNISSYMGMGRSNSLSNPADRLLECTLVESLFDYWRMIKSGGAHLLGSHEGWELNDPAQSLELQVDGEPRPDFKAPRYTFAWSGGLELLVPP